MTEPLLQLPCIIGQNQFSIDTRWSAFEDYWKCHVLHVSAKFWPICRRKVRVSGIVRSFSKFRRNFLWKWRWQDIFRTLNVQYHNNFFIVSHCVTLDSKHIQKLPHTIDWNLSRQIMLCISSDQMWYFAISHTFRLLECQYFSLQMQSQEAASTTRPSGFYCLTVSDIATIISPRFCFWSPYRSDNRTSLLFPVSAILEFLQIPFWEEIPFWLS